MDFKIKTGEKFRTVRCTKAAGVTIAAGRLVTLASGLIVEALTASSRVAYAPNGAASADTEVDVTIGNDFTLVGTPEQNYVVTGKGATCDITGAGGAQTIKNTTQSTNVLRLGISESAGIAGTVTPIEVQIALPLF